MKRAFRSTVASVVERLDGFRVEIDTERERADVVLHRPPLNIVRMPEREQLRVVFEELDRDAEVRVVVLRAEGEHFSSGGEIPGFLERSPEHVSELARNVAAPERCRKPVVAGPSAATASGSPSSSASHATSGSCPRPRSSGCRSSASA